MTCLPWASPLVLFLASSLLASVSVAKHPASMIHTFPRINDVKAEDSIDNAAPRELPNTTSQETPSTDDACPNQFTRLGSFCYHFSDIEDNWEGARGLCEGIGVFQEETIILGVLDFGLNLNDNQLLLTNSSGRGGTYWLGGHLDEISNLWRWVDQSIDSNREIDLLANYWYDDHPTTEGNCLMVTNNYRSYVKAADCSERSKVICQIIPKEIGFRTIGKDRFYFSTENSIAQPSSWQDARDFCLSLQPPNSFDHVDLAVLGLNHELDQELLQVIAQQGNDVWLGGTHTAHGDSGLMWIDNRTAEGTSYFWDHKYNTADPNARNYVIYAAATSVNGHARSRLRFCCPGSDCPSEYYCPYTNPNVVCQAYKG